MEEPEYASFLQLSTSMATQTSAKFSLFVGRASVSTGNPFALCKAPLTEPNRQICCNACNQDAATAFPAVSNDGIVGAAAGKLARAAADKEQINKIIEEYMLITGNNRIESEQLARKQADMLRTSEARVRRVEDMERKVLELREKERDRVLRIIGSLESTRPLTPHSTVSIKILSSVLTRLNAELTGNKNVTIPSGLRDFRAMTWEEWTALKMLSPNQRAAVDKLISEGLMRIDRNIRTLPNGTIINYTECDDLNLSATNKRDSANADRNQSAAPVQQQTVVSIPGLNTDKGQNKTDVSVDTSTDVGKVLQAAQDLVDNQPASNATRNIQRELELAMLGDPASAKQQDQFTPQLNPSNPMSDAIKQGVAPIPAGQQVPMETLNPDGTIAKHEQSSVTGQLSNSDIIYQQQLIGKLLNGTAIQTPIDRQQNSEMTRLSQQSNGGLLSAINATNAVNQAQLNEDKLHNQTKPYSSIAGLPPNVTATMDPMQRMQAEMAYANRQPKPANWTPPVHDRYRALIRYNVWGNVTNATEDAKLWRAANPGKAALVQTTVPVLVDKKIADPAPAAKKPAPAKAAEDRGVKAKLARTAPGPGAGPTRMRAAPPRAVKHQF